MSSGVIGEGPASVCSTLPFTLHERLLTLLKKTAVLFFVRDVQAERPQLLVHVALVGLTDLFVPDALEPPVNEARLIWRVGAAEHVQSRGVPFLQELLGCRLAFVLRADDLEEVVSHFGMP